MPKPIKFQFAGEESVFEMHKVDRSRLYGYKQLEVLDDQGQPCELTTLASDGRTLIGKGGTGIGYVDADGNWCNKESLLPVDLQGNSITPVPSSFAAPISLAEEATTHRLLDHNIRLIYELEGTELSCALKAKLLDGTIFIFPYSYRGGLEADAGFLLSNANEEIFFLVGDESKIEFKGLQQSMPIMSNGGDDEEDDLMDFDMI